jgi:hypothetical protein
MKKKTTTLEIRVFKIAFYVKYVWMNELLFINCGMFLYFIRLSLFLCMRSAGQMVSVGRMGRAMCTVAIYLQTDLNEQNGTISITDLDHTSVDALKGTTT